MSLASWTIWPRRESKRPAAPEKVNAITRPISAKTAPSTVPSPGPPPSWPEARWFCRHRKPTSMRAIMATNRAMTRPGPAAQNVVRSASIRQLYRSWYSEQLHGSPVCLHDEGAREGLSSRRPGAQGHLALVPARRQDRRPRLERRRQVDAAEDHGRRRDQLHRRGLPRPGGDGRLPASRSRSSIPTRTCAATSRRASPRSRRCSIATTPSTRASARTCRPRRWTRSSTSSPGCRTASTRPMPGISIRGSTSRWTRCACRRRTRTSRSSRAASGAAWRSAGCCCSRPTCCCSTSRPTTSTPSRWRGSSGS